MIYFSIPSSSSYPCGSSIFLICLKDSFPFFFPILYFSYASLLICPHSSFFSSSWYIILFPLSVHIPILSSLVFFPYFIFLSYFRINFPHSSHLPFLFYIFSPSFSFQMFPSFSIILSISSVFRSLHSSSSHSSVLFSRLTFPYFCVSSLYLNSFPSLISILPLSCLFFALSSIHSPFFSFLSVTSCFSPSFLNFL